MVQITISGKPLVIFANFLNEKMEFALKYFPQKVSKIC